MPRTPNDKKCQIVGLLETLPKAQQVFDTFGDQPGRLYPGVAPGSEKWTYPEIAGGTADRPQALNIVRPVLLYYPAEKATAVGTAMIVATRQPEVDRRMKRKPPRRIAGENGPYHH